MKKTAWILLVAWSFWNPAICADTFAEQVLGLDRTTVPGRNLAYAPADGSIANCNPPSFLWLPALKPEKISHYQIQLSRNAAFPPELSLTASTPFSVWVPERILEPGEWFWRYGAENTAGEMAWSRTRRFIVPDHITVFPYPDPSKFKITKASPRLLFNSENLQKIRKQMASPKLYEMTEKLVAHVHACAEKELIDEPEWLPPRNSKNFGRYYSSTLIATRPDMDLMSDAALAYLLTGDTACGEEAKRRILHFFSWDPAGSTGLAHNDEPAMWLMMRGCRAYDWTKKLFSLEERKKIERVMAQRARDFYHQLRKRPFENCPFVSHDGRIVGLLGEAAIALADGYPEEATQWLQYVSYLYWSVYPAWGREDGGWNEGPGYWQAYMEISLHFILALRSATGIDLSQKPFFANTAYYRFYLTPPGSRMMPFGDGLQSAPPGRTNVIYYFSTLLQDPYLRWHAENTPLKALDGVLGYLLWDEHLKPKEPDHLPKARYFPGIGLICSHSNLVNGSENIGFYFQSNPYGGVSHGHNSQNCFVLEAYGEALAIAAGEYDYYGSPHHEKWTQQTKAKCGITYDGGIGQKRGWTACGKIAAFFHSMDFDLIRGDASQAYGSDLSLAIRDVVRIRPDVFVIRDNLSGKKERRYEFQLHALTQMEIAPLAQRVTVSRPKASLEVRFLAPTDLKLSQSDTVNPPPESSKYAPQWHLTAQAQPAKSVDFLTVLLPYRHNPKAQLPKSKLLESTTAIGTELTWPDGRRCVVGFAKADAKGPYSLGKICFSTKVYAAWVNPAGESIAVLNYQF